MTEPNEPADLGRLSIVAAILAAVALLLFILPAEYGIDPTGFGGAIGLTDAPSTPGIDAFYGQDAPARNATFVVDLPATGAWKEVKFDMEAGMTLVFSWQADFVVQHDLHHDELGSFDSGEADARSGSFTAPEDGAFGWAFRSPTADTTHLVLEVTGHWN